LLNSSLTLTYTSPVEGEEKINWDKSIVEQFKESLERCETAGK